MTSPVPLEAVEIIIRETYTAFPLGVDQPDATDEQKDAAFISCNAAGHALMNVTKRHQQTLAELQTVREELDRLKTQKTFPDRGRADLLVQAADDWLRACDLIETLRAEILTLRVNAVEQKAVSKQMEQQTDLVLKHTEQQTDPIIPDRDVVDDLLARIADLEKSLDASRQETAAAGARCEASEAAGAVLASKLDVALGEARARKRELDRLNAKHCADMLDVQLKLSSTQDDLAMERSALDKTSQDLAKAQEEDKVKSQKLFTMKQKYMETLRELQYVTDQHSDSLGYDKTRDLITSLESQTTKTMWYNNHVFGLDPTTSHLSAMLAYATETLKLAPAPDPDFMVRALLKGANNENFRSAMSRICGSSSSPCFMAYTDFFCELVCQSDPDGPELLRKLADAGSKEEHAQIIDALHLALLPEDPRCRSEFPAFTAFFSQLRLHLRLDGARVATVYDAMYALREVVDRGMCFRDDARVAEGLTS